MSLVGWPKMLELCSLEHTRTWSTEDAPNAGAFPERLLTEECGLGQAD